MKLFSRCLLALLIVPALASPLQAQGFGQAIAVAEGRVFVGEPLNERSPGIVYVYAPQGSDWAETARIEAPEAFDGDHFGRTIVPVGDEVLIGSTSYDDGRGAVFVYRPDGSGGWTSAATIQPDDLSPRDYFGRAAAHDGDVALFATWGQGEGRGAVYALRRGSDGSWAVEAKLVPEDAAAEDWFGSGLSVQGDRALIGAFSKNEARGAAYVFARDPSTGDWTQEAKIAPEGLAQNARFGGTVLLEGDRGYVAASGEGQNTGAVYVIERDEAGEWEVTGKLLPFDGPRFGAFGASLLHRDGELWVGAPGADRQQGRIYRFARDDSGSWSFLGKLGTGGGEPGEQFGNPLSAEGDLVVAALGGDDYGAGTVTVLARGADGEWTERDRVWSETEGLDPVVGSEVACADGEATETGFPCRQTRLLSFLPVKALGGGRGVETNDVWGWTDEETGREYALVGLSDRTTFVDVTDPVNPKVLGWLLKTEGSPGSTWRDIKVYDDHAFVVSDNALEHGMQVFDLTKLRDAGGSGPVTFEEDAHYDGIASAHNIVIDQESGFAYAVGSSGGGRTCGGGLHMIDIREPTRPTFAGCFSDPSTGYSGTGYSHDAQCVVYRGPDEEHRGAQICLGSNENALSIADVTDKENPVALARATYPRVGYAHQGWLTEDHRYFFMDDEGDELNPELGLEKTRTMIWDVSDLDDPILVKEYMGTTFTSDHNLYVKGDRMYQSNYVSGLRVLDISDPENPVEIAYFDTVPWSEEPGFDGSWSNYPYFESGTIVVTSGREGVFMVKEDVRELVP